uniref:Ankyrin repeat domain-containing protein 31 n=1 Tax=Sus scrofa TaxID=9823 RepID=A0A8D1GEE9_PIG
MEKSEPEDRKDSECEVEMAEGAQAPDWDSDETVIDGSVTESDQEEEELPWRRLLFGQDASLGSEFSLHPGLNGIHKGIPSPEIQLGFKLREDPQEQINKNKMMPVLCEDAVLQQPQDEMEQNEALLHCPVFTVSFPPAELSLNHQSIGGLEPENPEVLPHTKKETSTDGDSCEISLLSSITIKEYDTFAVEEKSFIEPEKVLAVPNTFSELGKEVTLAMTSEETKDEESSLETFVSALEGLLTSPETTQEERLFGIMSDFEPRELMNPQNCSPNSVSIPLTCHRDLLENKKEDALPAELLASLNALSEAKVEAVYHRKEGGISLSAENECLGVEPRLSQIDEDCTQIGEVNFETLCSTPPFEQDSKLAELQNKHLSAQQTLEDPNLFGLETLVHQNVNSCDPLNNKGNSNPAKNSSDQDTTLVLRRSSRLKVGRDAKPTTDDMFKMPEKISPKILGCENQTSNNSSTENFRTRSPALRIEGKGKTMHSSRLKSGEQIRKNRKLSGKNEKKKMNELSLSKINRRNIFGENLLYKAALNNDTDLVHHCIKKGADVNQPSHAGWTALHEASVGGFYPIVNALLKGGADVNVRGMYQITPLHDAVMNGHYKVVKLLLLNGADPLFRNASGECALDEAKDSCMKRLLERYVPKHQKHLISALKNDTDPSDIEDAHQHKKPKFSSKNHSGFVCDENSNRQKPEYVKVNKGSKEGLFITKEDVYEHHQKDSPYTQLGKSKRKRSTLKQIYSTGRRKDNFHNAENLRTKVSKDKERRGTQCKRTQVDDAVHESSPRKTKTTAVSSSRGVNQVVTCQQHILQTFDDLPEESCKSFSPVLAGLKNGLGNNVETWSVSEETCTRSLNLSDSQEIKFVALESIDQAEAVYFSGLSLHKNTKFTDQEPHTHQEEQHISPYKSHANSQSGQKDESLSKWEKISPSFTKENFNNDDGDSCATEETVTSKKVIISSGCKNHENYKENTTISKKMDFQQFLYSEDRFSQENELKAGSLAILPQQEAVNFSNSDNVIVSEHVSDYEPCTCGTSFDHSQGSAECTSLACTRTLSTKDVSELTSHMELFESPQDCSPSTPTHLRNQTDPHTVEKEEKEVNTKRNYTDREQKTSSSHSPLSTVVHSQVLETTKVEKRREESKTIPDTDFYSTDSINKELTSISQLSQREEKEISHKPGEELTNNINGDESTIRNCEDKKEKTDLEIHMSTSIQEHKKVQNIRKRQNFLKATCSQEMKTAGINKRHARGESRLHLAARRGNLSLVKALIESGADVNLKDNAGWTPLHEAASEGCNDVIVELLKASANVNCENVDGILPLHDAVANSHLKHQTISSILQDIEEKQENLLQFEIRTPEDAEQYIDKMLKIKEVMDDVLAKQKAERDDLAKKYRVSIESFKHGVLREQLANLATRQKSLLLVAKKQKEISQKIHNYKNVTSSSDHSFRKLPCSSEICNEKDSREFAGLENSVQPQSGSLSPVRPVCGSMQKTQLCLEIWHDRQNNNTSPKSKTVRREEFCGNEMNSKRNVNDCTSNGLSKCRHSDGTKKIKLSSHPVNFIAQAEHSQKESDLTDTTAQGHASFGPSALIGTLNVSETTSLLDHSDAHPSAVIYDQALCSCDLKKGSRKTASQQPSRGTSESLAHQESDVFFGSNTGHQVKPYPKKSLLAVPHADGSQSSSSSGSGRQNTIKKPLNSSTSPKKKRMQIKDLILLGRINPGNNILEFKTQITYQGKELIKYVSEELPMPPDPDVLPQQHQPCLSGTSGGSMQSIPQYLHINEILLISDQEFLPCHIMDKHWKFYVECEELTF